MKLSDLLKSYRETTFPVDGGDFSDLEIRDAGLKNGFFYFYDTKANHLVTDFVLEERDQVATLCGVTLIKKGDKFTPRIKLWKVDKTKINKVALIQKGDVEKNPKLVAVKALVNTNECHENFWRVITFLNNLPEIDTPTEKFHMVDSDSADLLGQLKGKDKDTIVQTVATFLGGKLTNADLQLLAGRKSQLEHFEKLLNDEKFFTEEKTRLKKIRDEDVWQDFFEKNPWIFGYGLDLIACEALDEEKLERITTGADIFSGAGKRSDAVMKTRGYIGSLLFCEIKTPKTQLLHGTQYRPPDVFRVSAELIGGVSQVQKTTNKATRTLASYIEKLYKDDGVPLRVELSTIRPRQVLVIGHQRELAEEDGVNLEKSLSFELFRKSINDVEIITFDELLERAKFIVRDAS